MECSFAAAMSKKLALELFPREPGSKNDGDERQRPEEGEYAFSRAIEKEVTRPEEQSRRESDEHHCASDGYPGNKFSGGSAFTTVRAVALFWAGIA